jgi:hypothetical protein
LNVIRARGFEVNVHDLNHDGHLFDSEAVFFSRVKAINNYATTYKARGFRSAVLYRNPAWYGALQFDYDMSIPNVGRFDPQPGGCCTVFPYYIGDLIELPLTTTQDYTLFHILNDYSNRLWETQLELIRDNYGMAAFNIHPDYLRPPRALASYQRLLSKLTKERNAGTLWMALPGEVDGWWRARSQMRLSNNSGTWVIEGPQSSRACIAYAALVNGRLTYSVAAGNDPQLRSALPAGGCLN